MRAKPQAPMPSSRRSGRPRGGQPLRKSLRKPLSASWRPRTDRSTWRPVGPSMIVTPSSWMSSERPRAMPDAPLTICAQPGCPVLVSRGRCPQHTTSQSGGWRRHGAAAPKRTITGRALQRKRAELFTREPFCALCRIRLAAIRDHVIPLAEGGTDDDHNTQGLCLDCSDAKTQQEAALGRVHSR